MDRTQVAGVVLLATLPLLACDGQGTAPPDEILLGTQRVHGLDLSLSLDPATTVPSGNFTATLTVTNRRDSAVTLISGCTQLARGFVYRAADEEPAWFIGATGGCYTALSGYELDVGESFEQVWNVTAARSDYIGDFQFETTPAPVGDYVFCVSPDVITIDGESARLPEVQAAFRVNPAANPATFQGVVTSLSVESGFLRLTNITSDVLGAAALPPGTGVRFDAGTSVFVQRGDSLEEASVSELRQGQTLKVWTWEGMLRSDPPQYRAKQLVITSG